MKFDEREDQRIEDTSRRVARARARAKEREAQAYERQVKLFRIISGGVSVEDAEDADW